MDVGNYEKREMGDNCFKNWLEDPGVAKFGRAEHWRLGS